MLNFNLDKISLLKFFFITALVFVFFGGYFFLFVFNKNLFDNLDFLKLIILAISISFPFSVFGSFFCSYVFNLITKEELDKKNEKKINIEHIASISLSMSCVCSGLIFYIISFIGIYFKMEFHQALLVVIVVNLIFYIGFSVFAFFDNFKESKKSS